MRHILIAFVAILFLVNTAIAEQIIVEGSGVPASKNAPAEIKKNEAMIAAFFYGVTQIAEKLAEQKKSVRYRSAEKTKKLFVAFNERVGDFEVNSQTILEGSLMKEYLVNIRYKDDNFVLRQFELLSPPIEFVAFPRLDNLPKTIGGVEMKEAKWDKDSDLFTVKLVYTYKVVEAKAEAKKGKK